MSELKVNSIVDANSGNTAQINGMTPTADSLQGFRNRIINGNMVIDQRNAGASVSTDGGFPVDRFRAFRSGGAATFTSQRSTVAPPGFTNSILYTVGTGAAPGATDFSGFLQAVEGFNVSDFGWGTANAQPVTLSFWARSSITGTFGLAVRNGAGDRSYVASFAISAANTLEYKTITVPGDTSGTWLKDNGAGLTLFWDLGVGSTFSDTAGSWLAANKLGLTGGVKLIGTNGATFYITGVQLEVGSVATPFERRPFGTELALCQRYYETFNGNAQGTNQTLTARYAVVKRAAATVTRTGNWNSANEAGTVVSINEPAQVLLFNSDSQVGGTFTASSEL
jgi:hypothetical protein